jgi:hypothetical protein
MPGVSFFGSYEFGTPEVTALKSAVVEELASNGRSDRQAQAWADALTFHHQWMVLSREHVAALLQHRREVIEVSMGLVTVQCSTVQYRAVK